jgi:hypothetical protein
MKIVLENRITSVTASSSAANYPATELLNDSPKRIWKADGDDTATITATASGTINTIVLFNTNAEAVTITIADPNYFSWQNLTWRNLNWRNVQVPVESELVSQAGTTALWATIDTITAPIEITIELSGATGATIQAGVLVAGEAVDVGHLLYGFQEGMADFSVAEQLMNGAHYYKSRDRVRTFTVSARPKRETLFYTFMADFARTYGLAPKAMHLMPKCGSRWIVYARLGAMPTGTHSHLERSSYQATIREVV